MSATNLSLKHLVGLLGEFTDNEGQTHACRVTGVHQPDFDGAANMLVIDYALSNGQKVTGAIIGRTDFVADIDRPTLHHCPQCGQRVESNYGPCPDCLNQMQGETPL